MANEDTIRAALAQLDPTNDDHWADDLPKTSVVQKLANDQTIKRSDIQSAAPGFNRSAARFDVTAEAPAASQVQESAPTPEARELTEDELRTVLMGAVHDAEAAIVAARQKGKEATEELAAATVARDQARKNYNTQFPPLTAAENIKMHIASENARRAARATGGRPQAQIDMAMGRSNTRGWGRKMVRGIQGPDGNLLKGSDGKVLIPQQMQHRPGFAAR